MVGARMLPSVEARYIWRFIRTTDVAAESLRALGLTAAEVAVCVAELAVAVRSANTRLYNQKLAKRKPKHRARWVSGRLKRRRQ